MFESTSCLCIWTLNICSVFFIMYLYKIGYSKQYDPFDDDWNCLTLCNKGALKIFDSKAPYLQSRPGPTGTTRYVASRSKRVSQFQWTAAAVRLIEIQSSPAILARKFSLPSSTETVFCRDILRLILCTSKCLKTCAGYFSKLHGIHLKKIFLKLRNWEFWSDAQVIYCLLPSQLVP